MGLLVGYHCCNCCSLLPHQLPLLLLAQSVVAVTVRTVTCVEHQYCVWSAAAWMCCPLHHPQMSMLHLFARIQLWSGAYDIEDDDPLFVLDMLCEEKTVSCNISVLCKCLTQPLASPG